MVMECVDGLPVSMTQVVKGQVGMEFRPIQPSQISVWEELHRVLMDSGKLAFSDRLDGFVIYITNFQNIEEAIGFLMAWEFRVKRILEDEFALVWKQLW
jgi:hypothetical protein